jgi:putative transposase
VVTHQAFRFALDPTAVQRRALASHCGAARFAFNWAYQLVKTRLDARCVDGETEVPLSLPALRREWNQGKEEAAPWWRENSKEAYNSGLEGLARALANFFAARKGKRKGAGGTEPWRANLHLPRLRAEGRPRPQRGAQPRLVGRGKRPPGRRQCGGDRKRAWRGRKTWPGPG